MFTPVTNDARSEQRKAITAATSSAPPGLPRGTRPPSRSRVAASPSNATVKGVSISPGETALTRTEGPYSSAADWVSASTPALAAAYGASPLVGRIPLTDATFTMAPPPDATNLGASMRIPWKVPRRLASSTRS